MHLSKTSQVILKSSWSDYLFFILLFCRFICPDLTPFYSLCLNFEFDTQSNEDCNTFVLSSQDACDYNKIAPSLFGLLFFTISQVDVFFLCVCAFVCGSVWNLLLQVKKDWRKIAAWHAQADTNDEICHYPADKITSICMPSSMSASSVEVTSLNIVIIARYEISSIPKDETFCNTTYQKHAAKSLHIIMSTRACHNVW